MAAATARAEWANARWAPNYLFLKPGGRAGIGSAAHRREGRAAIGPRALWWSPRRERSVLAAAAGAAVAPRRQLVGSHSILPSPPTACPLVNCSLHSSGRILNKVPCNNMPASSCTASCLPVRACQQLCCAKGHCAVCFHSWAPQEHDETRAAAAWCRWRPPSRSCTLLRQPPARAGRPVCCSTAAAARCSGGASYSRPSRPGYSSWLISPWMFTRRPSRPPSTRSTSSLARRVRFSSTASLAAGQGGRASQTC